MRGPHLARPGGRRCLSTAALTVLVAAGAPSGASAFTPGTTLNLLSDAAFTPFPATVDNSFVNRPFSSQAGRTVTPDGRFVVFVSNADGMTVDGASGATQVFRRDTVTGTTILVSRATGGAGAVADQPAGLPTISDDGTRVAFTTAAPLDPADTNTIGDVYLRNLATDTTTLISRSAGGIGNFSVSDAEISASGGHVVFSTTASNLHPDDTDTATDVYRRTVGTTELVLVSRRDLNDTKASQGGSNPSVSADGSVVAFESFADDLAPGQVADASFDVFVRRITGATTGETELVSRATGAGADANGQSQAPSIDPGGTRVAFASAGTNVTGDDTSTDTDVFLRDVSADTTTYVSRRPGDGAVCEGVCSSPIMTVAGATVAVTFAVSLAPTFSPGSPERLIAQRILAPSTQTRIVSRAVGTAAPIVSSTDFGASGSGLHVAFASQDDAASTQDSNDHSTVYVHAPDTVTQLVSRPTGAGPFSRGLGDTEVPSDGDRHISADGRYVLFASDADILLPPGAEEPTEVRRQLYRRDLLTGETILVSRGDGAAGPLPENDVDSGAISADGRYVAFAAISPTIAAQFGAAGAEQAYRRDVLTGETVLVSRVDGPTGDPSATGLSDEAVSISGDGRRVAFVSDTPGLAPGQSNTEEHVFVRDVAGGSTILASRRDGADGVALENGTTQPSLDLDGDRVAFESGDDAFDGNAATAEPVQIAVRDLRAGTTTTASRSAAGVLGNDNSFAASLSASGERVAFTSESTNLDPADTDASDTAYVAGPGAGAIAVQRADGLDGAVDTESTSDIRLSRDGSIIIFDTDAGLDPSDSNTTGDVYVRDLDTGRTRRASVGSGPVQIDRRADTGDVSDRGRCVLFSTSSGLVAPGSPTSADVVTTAVSAVFDDCPTPAPVVPDPGPTTPGAGGGGGTGAGGGGGGVAADVTRPGVSRLRLARSRFRVGPKSTATTAQARRRTAAGTTVLFTLSERATLRFTIARVLTGRRSGSRCVKPTARLRRARRCDRFVTRGALTRRALEPGARRVAFSGRIGRRALPAGRYRMSVVATDAAGNRSAARRVTFTVVRR